MNNNSIRVAFTLPTTEEHSNLSNQFPIDVILGLLNSSIIRTISIHPFNTINLQESQKKSILNTWYSNVETLLFDIKYAYGFLLFFYNAGIPDERVTDYGTESNKFFPDFEPQHWYNQTSFRFYAEIIISKIFSILDNYGIILYLQYDENFNYNQFKNKKNKYINFNTPINDKNLNIDVIIKEKLQLILENEVYKNGKKIRNDIVHNKTPLKLSSNLAHINSGSGSAMVKQIDYKKSKEVIQMIENLMSDILIESTKYIFSNTNYNQK